MDKLYILVVISCKAGETTTETEVFADLVSAKIAFYQEYKYLRNIAPAKTASYDGFYGNNKYWFEIGETDQNIFWSRGEIQTRSINN